MSELKRSDLNSSEQYALTLYEQLSEPNKIILLEYLKALEAERTAKESEQEKREI